MAKHLILVPTALEYRYIEKLLDGRELPDTAFAICGFALIHAGVETTRILHQQRPQRVTLVGLAGVYQERLTLGQAYEFARVGCYGIGAGDGSTYETAESLGWRQLGWPGDELNLVSSSAGARADDLLLLSCCAASGQAEDVQRRCAAFPGAAAEDMEAYAVKVACDACEVPLRIVRGMSNRAGDRDQANWCVDEALRSALSLVLNH